MFVILASSMECKSQQMFSFMQHNNNRLLLVAAWCHYSIMQCLSEKPTLEYYKLENTLRNKISCSKPYLFYFVILLETLLSYLRLNSWELEAKNRRLNTPTQVSCLLILNINRMQITTSVRQIIIIWRWRANIIQKFNDSEIFRIGTMKLLECH